MIMLLAVKLKKKNRIGFANGINIFAKGKIRGMSLAAQLALLSPVYVPLILSALLLAGSGFRNRAKMWLSLAMFNASLVFLGNYLYFSHNYLTYSYLHSLHIFSVLAVYPSVYVYVKLLTNPQFRIKEALVHFLPGLLFFMLSAAGFYLFLTPEQRIYFLSTYRLHPTYDNFTLRFLFVVRFFNIGALFAQIILYGFLIFRVLSQHRKQIGDLFSDTEKIRLSWIVVFNTSIIIAAFLSIFFYAVNPVKLFGDEKYLIAPLYLFAAVIWVLGILGNNQKEIFAEREIHSSEDKSEETQPVSDDQLNRALLLLMEKEKPYLRSDLKIWDLSTILRTNRTYISRLINQVHGCNFNQFINRYRVEYSKTLLLKTDRMIEEIATISGFGSVSTFIRAFRESEGITPMQWRKQRVGQ